MFSDIGSRDSGETSTFWGHLQLGYLFLGLEWDANYILFMPHTSRNTDTWCYIVLWHISSMYSTMETAEFPSVNMLHVINMMVCARRSFNFIYISGDFCAHFLHSFSHLPFNLASLLWLLNLDMINSPIHGMSCLLYSLWFTSAHACLLNYYYSVCASILSEWFRTLQWFP